MFLFVMSGETGRRERGWVEGNIQATMSQNREKEI